ncbi:MAG: sigma-54 dependent transcriptional regulator [Gemmatimonadales bacterium]|jgi:DNA-binding NtrC family response regulator
MIPKVYILDDDRTYAKLLAANLGKSGGFRNEIFDTYQELAERRAEEPADAVITDLVMPGVDGIEVTRRLRRSDPHLPIFVLTAHADLSTAIEALKAGANEYLTKPVNMDELVTLLTRALEERPLREEAATIQQVRKEEFSLQSILGEHPEVDEVREFVKRVAAIPRPTVLLLGESGTGKNLVARTIHYSSPHSQGRFVEINCSALPSQLLEAELFGYQKGAFTDARESKRGLIEVADGGTLFLDEIGDLSKELQAKLLNFLESRTFRRLGGTEEIEVSQRVITATNRNLQQAVRAGDFRSDLFYRISVATHSLPPLREIKQDLPLLAEHFRAAFNHEFRKDVERISEEALDTLQAWHWPGNVRELRNVIERAMIFAEGTELRGKDLPDLSSVEIVAGPVDTEATHAIPRGVTLADAEREYIRQTLANCGGSIQRAAEVLGISRKNLWEKRKKYGLLD